MKEKRDFVQMEVMIGNMSMSEGDNQDFQFEHIKKEKVLKNTGGIIFVSLLMIVGFGGNSIAIFVYLQKYKQSSYRTFIVTLSIVDLATCCAAMIFILLTLIYPINFFNDWTCKLCNFLTHSMCIGSSLILVTIAVERYRKICVPFGIQLSAGMSKYICILDIVLGIALSWPAAILYGDKSVKIGVNQTAGKECDLSDDFANTNYPVYFTISLLFLVFATIIFLSITYAFIGKQIFRMKKKISRKPPNHISQDDLVTVEFFPSECSPKKEESKEEKVQNIYDDRSNISIISFKANGQEKQSTDSKGKTHVFCEGGPNQKENETRKTGNRNYALVNQEK
ncbi:hypothetical protein CHS0354_035978 [Potamilus streckersoni]|uniref:G-protein coupled receptors family 1 profile domain-containing protein n=1 Tax=Potamilus streckersoni TaxID=2493646 RepID=A0AAE0VTW1_9BIVA|nr:hypothetical protein CHS0354_035978 [Potamilus streckersoni]